MARAIIGRRRRLVYLLFNVLYKIDESVDTSAARRLEFPYAQRRRGGAPCPAADRACRRPAASLVGRFLVSLFSGIFFRRLCSRCPPLSLGAFDEKPHTRCHHRCRRADRLCPPVP